MPTRQATFWFTPRIIRRAIAVGMYASIVWCANRFWGDRCYQPRLCITRMMIRLTTARRIFRCMTPTLITCGRPWLASAQSGPRKAGGKFWQQHGAEGRPLPVGGQNEVVQCAANLTPVAQSKRVQVIPAFDKRPLGLGVDDFAVVKRLNVEPAIDLADCVPLMVKRVIDALVTGQAAISADYKPLTGKAAVEFVLLGHGLVQAQSLQPTLGQLGLYILHLPQLVLGQPAKLAVRNRRRGYFRVSARHVPASGSPPRSRLALRLRPPAPAGAIPLPAPLRSSAPAVSSRRPWPCC